MTTWGKWYWPVLLSVITLLIMGPEIWALVTNVNNTLSDWVWRALHVTRDQQEWTAAHYLVFCLWLSLNSWLTWHFFFRRFT